MSFAAIVRGLFLTIPSADNGSSPDRCFPEMFSNENRRKLPTSNTTSLFPPGSRDPVNRRRVVHSCDGQAISLRGRYYITTALCVHPVSGQGLAGASASM